MKLSTVPISLLLSALRPAHALPEIPERVDVVIIGAGAAGLSAAARFEEFPDDAVSYVVLEAQDKVGGRVQSRVLNSETAPGFEGNHTVEDGANWITDFPGNPIFELAREYKIDMALQEFFDIDAYQGNVSISKKTMDSVQKEFVSAWNCLQQETNVPYTNGGKDGFGQTQEDIGAIALLELCGWSITDHAEDNIKYFWQWYYMEYEYAQSDVSLATFPGTYAVILTVLNVTSSFYPHHGSISTNCLYVSEDAFFKPTYLVTDQNGGFQRLFEDFMHDRVNRDNVFMNSEVTLIEYDQSVAEDEDNDGYNAKVYVEGLPNPGYILCKRVISTLSVGILEDKADSLFDPPINTDLLDLEMMQYIKVFYQFENKFWGDEEFILTMNENPFKRGNCEHWQNLATTGKNGNTDTGPKGTTSLFGSEDSNILFCTIITESYLALLDEERKLSDATLDSFLEPLELAFDDYESPTAKFSFAWNNNEYSGYGSFSNWQVTGKTFTQNLEGAFKTFV